MPLVTIYQDTRKVFEAIAPIDAIRQAIKCKGVSIDGFDYKINSSTYIPSADLLDHDRYVFNVDLM